MTQYEEDRGTSLIDDYFSDQVSRAELLRRAAALGVGAGLFAALGGAAEGATREQLTMAISATPPGWDVDQDFGPNAHDIMYAIGDYLVVWKDRPSRGQAGGLIADISAADYGKHIRPGLAERWSKRGNTLTFQLRRGVMSHAGNELTAEDVRWTYARSFALKAIGAFLNGIGGLKSAKDVRVLDRYTVSFRLSQPVDIFFMSLTLPHRAVLDSTEMKKHASAGDPYAAKWGRMGDAGFGRYRIASATPGNQVVLEAVPNHRLGAPPIRRVVLREVPSSSGRLALVSRGSVDAAYELLPRELISLKGNKDVRVWNFPGTNIAFYQLNAKFKPLDNVLVRRALAYAAPYNDVINGVFQGYARRSGGVVVSVFPGSKDYFQKYTTDLNRAKTLLRAAGVGGGFTTEIAYRSELPAAEQMAILFQTNLAKIGVRAKLRAMTSAAFGAMQFAKETRKKIPIVVNIDGPFVPHPYYDVSLWLKSDSPTNLWQVNIPELDRLLNQQAKLPTLKQVVASSAEAQRIIADQVPAIWVAEPGIQVATRRSVRGVGAHIAYLNYQHFKV